VGVRNYLVEGVSGAGKTAVADELTRRGFRAVHGDRELAYQGDPVTGAPTDTADHEHHLWDVEQVRALVADTSEPVTFFCGGSRNVGSLVDLFDGVFVLEVDRETLVRRLEARPAGEWGSAPAERAQVLRLHASGADVPPGVAVDATRPLVEVVDELVRSTTVRVLSVLPYAGGNVEPTVAVLGRLAARGAEVEVLGHEPLRRVVEAAGLGFTPFERARRWSPVHERPGRRDLLRYLTLASDRGTGADLAAAARRRRPDVVLVDCMVPGALAAARATGAPVAMVVHTLSAYWAAQWAPTAPMGAWLRATRAHPAARANRPDLALLTTMPELDSVGARWPFPVRQTGPVVGDVRRGDEEGERVLVSLSTISYPGQREVLQRLTTAAGRTGRAVTVTTGPSIDPSSIRALAGVEVRGFVPHADVLPQCRLVVGHGGHGTTMRALAHGVPVLVVPLSAVADHRDVADAVVRAGVGATVAASAPVDELARAMSRVLADEAVRRRARALADRLATHDPLDEAARAVEELSVRRPADG
jgi:UDP:flavonoid glycosyltransferase YjiC (YdhE family)